MTDDDLLIQLRSVALGLPGVSEKISQHCPAFYVRKRAFGRFHSSDFAADGRPSLWCQAEPGVAADMAASDPDRFYQPEPSAGGVFSSWLGVFLDTEGEDVVVWAEIAAIVTDAYRQVAPKKLIAQLDES